VNAATGDLVRIGFRWGGFKSCPLALIVSQSSDGSGRSTYLTLVEGRRGLHSFYDYQIARVVNRVKETTIS
jgi:hypothetical protein